MIITFFSLLAGLLGSMTGLGGGVLIIPFLTLVFHVPLPIAMGASLVSIVTSSLGSSLKNTQDGLVDTKLALFFAVGTTIAAFAGSLLTLHVPSDITARIFGAVLLGTALISFFKKGSLHSSSSTGAFVLLAIAGLFSGFLGVGCGALSVTILEKVMKLRLDKAVATSNTLIGITASVSLLLFFQQGLIDPSLTTPVVLGVLVGSFIGSRLVEKVPLHILKLLYLAIVIAAAFEMLLEGVGGL